MGCRTDFETASRRGRRIVVVTVDVTVEVVVHLSLPQSSVSMGMPYSGRAEARAIASSQSTFDVAVVVDRVAAILVLISGSAVQRGELGAGHVAQSQSVTDDVTVSTPVVVASLAQSSSSERSCP
jgi:hypothetical protein